MTPPKRTGNTGRHTVARRRQRARARPAGPLLLLAPLGVAAASVAVAAGHVALGSPFGAAFAGKLWDLTQTLWLMLVPYAFTALGVARTNRAAIAFDAAEDARALGPRSREIDVDVDLEDDPPGKGGALDHDNDVRGPRRRR